MSPRWPSSTPNATAVSDANITTFGDAIWWSTTPVTTLGYGDRFPTTAEGRYVAAGLMLAGIALLGVVTAALASWFAEGLGEVEAAGAETRENVAELALEVRSTPRGAAFRAA